MDIVHVVVLILGVVSAGYSVYNFAQKAIWPGVVFAIGALLAFWYAGASGVTF